MSHRLLHSLGQLERRYAEQLSCRSSEDIERSLSPSEEKTDDDNRVYLSLAGNAEKEWALLLKIDPYIEYPLLLTIHPYLFQYTTGFEKTRDMMQYNKPATHSIICIWLKGKAGIGKLCFFGGFLVRVGSTLLPLALLERVQVVGWIHQRAFHAHQRDGL